MIQLTSQSNSAARFFICQYVRDPFRQEPRNVGVIVESPDGKAGRFWGDDEGGSGSIDGRTLTVFADPDNYRNWVHFWRRAIDRDRPSLEETLTRANRQSFSVVNGGYVGDIQNDSPDQIANFLFKLLVGDHSFDDAIESSIEEKKSSGPLAGEVSQEFRKLGLFDSRQFKYPIFRDRDLFGKTKPHRFNFVQQNGTACPMEVFDFSRSKPKAIEHHVGWARFAFDDLAAAEDGKVTKPISLISPPKEGASGSNELFKQSLDVLSGASRIVDWTKQKDEFLRERVEYATGTGLFAG
ncbi:MAG: hypothetical protein F9B45_22170 [Phycisphaera sp. RhM]|nr:hypothetical protein [Phycisphaera sp. RhM]